MGERVVVHGFGGCVARGDRGVFPVPHHHTSRSMEHMLASMSGPEIRNVLERRTRMLASPVFVFSVVVLVVNDHVLKSEFPGFVTGKLSDVAGVAMVAIIATVLVGRPRTACTSTGVAFAALKSIDAVADAAVPVLGGRTLTDHTDVAAVLVLFPLAHWMRRTQAERPERTQRNLSPLKLMALGAAVLATSASSQLPVGVQSVRAGDGEVIAVEGDRSFVSTDGRRWEARESKSVTATEPPLTQAEERRSCAGDVCFEIIAKRIERTEDGDTVVEYELTDDDVRDLEYEFDDTSSSTGDILRSIAAVDTSDGIVAVASMGELGVVYRSADGEWEQAAVGDNTPEGLPGRAGWAPALLAALIVLLAIATLPVGFLASRSRRSIVGYVLKNVGGVVVLTLLAGLAYVADLFGSREKNHAVVLWIPLHFLAVGFGAMMLWLAGRRRPVISHESPPYPPVAIGSTPPPPPNPVDRRG